MRIYLLTRTTPYGYDEYYGVVICAKSRQRAIKICNDNFFKKSECELIGTANNKQQEGEILSAFNAG